MTMGQHAAPDDDEDEDLRAALALSMQENQVGGSGDSEVGAVSGAAAMDTETAAKPAAAAAGAGRPSPSSTSSAAAGAGEFDCRSFHELMWDDRSTTANDKERWLYERISTPFLMRDEANSDGGSNLKSPPEAAAASAGVSPAAAASMNNSSCEPPTPLEVFTGSRDGLVNTNHTSHNATPPQQLWGLTQKHGGPCGVLAAIQAEMIRVLLFGRGGGKKDLYYPFNPTSAENYSKCEAAPISSEEVREAMSMAIGMILARASLAPSASSAEPLGCKCSDGSVQLVLPDGACNDQSAAGFWMQEMLGNPAQSNSESAAGPSGLRVHAITSGNDLYAPNGDASPDTSPEIKRARSDRGVSFFDEPKMPPASPVSGDQVKMAKLAKSVSEYLLKRGGGLEHFRGPGGVMYLVMSLVRTRGIDRIRSDMDDPTTTITSQFGHSSQELMNLLLTGQAVSNVFDNDMTTGGLACHGIQRRPAVGYLSILESLRYCEVGGYYKSPLFPIWVVGSTSHFSVLFGDERCLQESKSDILLEKCRRAFKKVEGGDENGFILVDKLGEVIDELDLKSKVGGDHGVQTLKAYLEVSGAGIILWDGFWKAISRLMTGSSLESIMSMDDDEMADALPAYGPPPLLVTEFGEADNATTAPAAAAAAAASASAAPIPTHQSDEELAKKLAAEWGSMPDQTMSDHSNAKSDEDLARELQAQWDAENAAGAGDALMDLASQVATTDDVATLASVADRPPTPIPDRKMAAAAKDADDAREGTTIDLTGDSDCPAQNHRQLEFEKHGLTFDLYHYNGLYGGTLTPFRLTRLSPTEAVGASIALSSKGGGSGHGGGNGDLEDVVRTKWPSSMVNWFGKSPPSID